jgi:integrase
VARRAVVGTDDGALAVQGAEDAAQPADDHAAGVHRRGLAAPPCQAEERLALGLPSSSDVLVFTRYDGATLNPRNFSKAFTRLVAGAGLDHVSFHSLRHSHITQLLAAGEHVKVVSERAGHASVAITLGIYAHVIPGMQAGVADRLDAALRLVVGEPERLG